MPKIDLEKIYDRHLDSINKVAKKLNRPPEDLAIYLIQGTWPDNPAGAIPGLNRPLVRGSPAETRIRAIFLEAAFKDMQAVLDKKPPGISIEALTRIASTGKKTLDSLDVGRPLGSEANRERGKQMNTLWRDASKQLSRNQPDMDIDAQAAYIRTQEVGKKENGKPYAVSYIRKAIRPKRRRRTR